VTSDHLRRNLLFLGVYALTALSVLATAQKASPDRPGTALVMGSVRDPVGRPLANADVSLQPAATAEKQNTHTDPDGTYRFADVRDGLYAVHVEIKGYRAAVAPSVRIARGETRNVDFTLVPIENPASSQSPEFFDEPQFTVAGVTQATSSGGHGSETVLRTTEALAKATVSLGNESNAAAATPVSSATEAELRDTLTQHPQDPALHHSLGDLEEKLGKPLDAVREYQRAAELDPTEPNLFDWGTELLAHRALEPATEVFAKGNSRFPQSVRLLIGLGVSWYARGAYDLATKFLISASDFAPDNPTPYLFLGKLLSVETTPSEGSVERLARFASLQPDNALANYYYAIGLVKQPNVSTGDDAERSTRVESLLQKAVHLDATLGAAYLQLGILYSQRSDLHRAISAYQQAIDASKEDDETLAEAHYRLAQVYQRMGDQKLAQAELELHASLIRKIKEKTIMKRSMVQEFVVSLRHQNSAAPAKP
jgi:tetratricopeptide (TPR) repeat protein